MHHPLRRTLPALAALGIATAAPLVTAGPAQAIERCGSAAVEYSVDNGATWQNNDRMSAPYGSIQVRLDGNVDKGCSYQVSLASYSTQGPTWGSSGTQAFLGWATTTLDSGKRQATLDISADMPPCFGQIDLYNGATKYDGISGPLPKYPTGVFPDNLISAWNGGSACQVTPTPPAPSPSSSKSAPSSPSPSPSSSTPPPPSPSAPAPASPSGPSSPGNSPSPSPSGSSSTPASSPTKSSPSAPAGTVPSPSAPAPSGSAAATDEPVGTPSVKPVSATPTGLAFTGTNGGQLVTFGVGGAVLIAIGAGAVLFTRRRNAHR
ncbi:hypothetical protein [Kitasatospora sp. NBC_01266]|uniref:hypothetical protein n=1 Tax=Kitasatospora sp. NBC_01266 TaxID=2903572 RepID=UPI002E3475D5|nr:hypothetical protein [Kitasatospora sp. NBC_01266]